MRGLPSTAWRFAVIGDTHFVRPQSHQKALSGQGAGLTELADLKRNQWFSEQVLPTVLADIAAAKPDFIIHTGDIIPGHCDSDEAYMAEMKMALERLDTIGAPLVFSTGSHDGVLGRPGDTALRQVLYPRIADFIGQPVEQSYYVFERHRCLFIALDFLNWDDQQRDFLETNLQRRSQYERVFLFCHAPFMPIARPFFTNMDFAREVAALLESYGADAYFCGHTHNHTATLHMLGEHVVAQLKSTPLGYPYDRQAPVTMEPGGEPAVLLSDVRPLLPEPPLTHMGWGFLEDSVSGWWLVTVQDGGVTMQWQVPDSGTWGVLYLPPADQPKFLQKPAVPTTVATLPNLSHIRQVRIRLAGSGNPTATIRKATLNGVDIPVPPPLVYFDSRQFIELPPESWPLLKSQNQLSLWTEGEVTVGGCVIEVLHAEGITRSRVSGYATNNPRHLQAGRCFSALDDSGMATFALPFEQ